MIPFQRVKLPRGPECVMSDRRTLIAATCALALALPEAAMAQPPSQITIVVTVAAGGSSDIGTRTIDAKVE